MRSNKTATLYLGVILFTSLMACGGRELGNDSSDSGITGSGDAVTPPKVTAISPSDLSTGVNRDASIQITFSVAVNSATVTMTSNTTCTGSIQVSTDSNFGAGTCLAMNQTVTQSGIQVTVRTAGLMTASTPHYIRITTAVAGGTGLTMQTQFNSNFTTGTSLTPLNNEFGTDCSGGASTIATFKTAATGTEGAVGPLAISGLVVTGIDRFGSFYLQKGTEGIYVDVNTTAGACGTNCLGNKASYYGLQVGDEICLSITRAVETNAVDTVKDYDAIKKTGIGTVSPQVLTDVFPAADISEWIRISGYLTTKTAGGNVNHTLTFADGKTIVIRDNTSNKFNSINQNDYIQVTSVASWFGGAPQIMIDTGVGTVSTGVTAPSYSVTGTISGWRSGENFTLTLNGSNATVISANGAFSFTGSPTVTGQYTVAMSVNPPNDVCTLGNASGYATANISSVTVSCTPKPMYQLTSWAASEVAGTYPLAMQLYLKSGAGADETALVTVDAPYTLLYSSAYNLTSGARLMGKDADGFSFLNSGSTANTYLGTAVMTIDTTGKTALRLNWTGRSVTVLARPYRIAVQTRTSPSGSWTNTGSFYAANATAGHSQTFSAVDISALDNQVQGQIRFVYYQEGAGSGNRPELAIDDIVIYSASNAKPWLTGFSPGVSATGVSVTPTVSVTFNKAMNTGTVTTGNLYIVAGTNCSNTPITAAISASNGDRTFSFSPTGLTGSTQYSTCVKAAITDTTADTIGTDRVISWTTVAVDVTPPTLSSTTPANAATGVAVGSTIAVTFSEAMNTSTVTAQTAAGACSGSIQVSTQANNFASCIAMTASAPTFSGGNTIATFTPASALTASTTYLIRVTTAVQDTSSNALATQFTTGTGFTTAAADVTPPTISSTTPANAATGVSASTTIAVTFSEAMSTGTVTAQTSAGACTGSVQVSTAANNFSSCIAMTTSAPTFSGGNTIATLTPGVALTASTTYKIRVTTTVQDVAGNALATQFETATGFTTNAGTPTYLLQESFNYGGTGADLTTATTNWTVHSGGTTNPVQYNTTPLTMSGYCSGGGIGAATFTTTGQDVNRTFTTQTSTTVYVAALVNLTSIGNTTGDYFFHTGNGTGNFFGRVYVRNNGSGGVNFGITKSGAIGTVIWSATTFSTATTYLVVIKANANGTTGSADLFVLTASTGTEPAATATATDTSTITNNAGVYIRQGTTANMPAGKIGCITVGSTWASLFE